MEKSEFRINEYLKASAIGALRGLIGLPLEHPLDCIKTRWQSQPHIKSGLLIAKEIYNTNGIRGFYAGCIPNSLRIAFKQAYRWPMMLAFPKFFKTILPNSTQEKYPSMNKALTGGTIASIEAFIITPLERLKVWLMTYKKSKHPILVFFKSIESNISSELFRGLNASYPRQMISWTTFLVTDDYFKRIFRNRHDNTDNKLTFTELLIIGFGVGAINTLTVMPIDCIKTQLQMYQSNEFKTVFKTAKDIYRKHGINGLFVGWRIKMAQYILQSVFTVTAFEKLEYNLNH